MSPFVRGPTLGTGYDIRARVQRTQLFRPTRGDVAVTRGRPVGNRPGCLTGPGAIRFVRRFVRRRVEAAHGDHGHRSGHDLEPGDHLRRRRRPAGDGPAGTRADLPQGRLGRARSHGDLAQHPRGDGRRAGEVEPVAERHRCGRHHAAAGDDGRLEPHDRPADLQRDRLAGHADPGDMRRARQHSRRGPLPADDRPSAGHLLLRAQGPLDPGQRPRRARPGRVRGASHGHHRHLAAVEPHQRPRARDRPQQCLPDPAHGPRHPAVGPRTRRRDGCADEHAPGDSQFIGGLRRGPEPGIHARCSHCGNPGRPAGGHLRSGVPEPRRGEEHLRNGQLPAPQHRNGEGAEQQRAAHDRLLQDR